MNLLVMVVGDGDAALDFAWAIHQSTPAALRSDYTAWHDGDAQFRVAAADAQDHSVLVHASAHPDWGVPRADIVIRAGATAALVGEVRAAAFPRPFDAWKHALTLALAARAVAPALELPTDLVPVFVEHGERALAADPALDPMVALTRASPGVRLVYSASFVDQQIRNGSFAQLFWTAVSTGREELISAGADALHTLGVTDAGDTVDEAIDRVTRHMDRLQRCLGVGVNGFGEFRDHSELADLSGPYWQKSRDLTRKLGEFARTNAAYVSRPAG